MATVLNYLETLMHETHKTESEMMTLAFETGLRQLWRERTLGRYLRGEVSRDETIAALGLDWVELAERQHQAVTEDLAWALQQP
jgi:hypothetical protein